MHQGKNTAFACQPWCAQEFARGVESDPRGRG
jgi:hypothetical protein